METKDIIMRLFIILAIFGIVISFHLHQQSNLRYDNLSYLNPSTTNAAPTTATNNVPVITYGSFSYRINSKVNNNVYDQVYNNISSTSTHIDIDIGTTPLIYPLPKSIYNMNTYIIHHADNAEDSSINSNNNTNSKANTNANVNVNRYVLSTSSVDIKLYLRHDIVHHEQHYKKLFGQLELPRQLPREVYDKINLDFNLDLNVLEVRSVHVHVLDRDSSPSHASSYKHKHKYSEYWVIIDMAAGKEASVTIVAYDISGVNYGFQTLLQLLEQHAMSNKEIPLPVSCIKSFPLVVHDYADYKWRGMCVVYICMYTCVCMIERVCVYVCMCDITIPIYHAYSILS